MTRFPKLEKIVRNEIIKDLPDTQAFAQMGSLFGGFDEGGGISINIQSNDQDAARAAAKKGMTLLTKEFPEAVVNTNPSLDIDQPQLKMTPDDRSIAEAGWTRGDVGSLVQAFGEGLYVGQRYDGERQLFLIMKSQTARFARGAERCSRRDAEQHDVPFGHLVSMQRTLARERHLSPRSPAHVPDQFPAAPRHGAAGCHAQIKGCRAADPQAAAVRRHRELRRRRRTISTMRLWNMGKNFGLAVLLLFLIMAALFKSVWDSFIATIALPLGMVGGMARCAFWGCSCSSRSTC
jgi:multidrug efflux pump subunit AcrB